LPGLRRSFQELHDLRDAIRVAAPRHETARSHADGNGGGTPGAVPYLQASGRFQAILRELSELGVLVKDLDSGLVDIPHLKDGEEVFLCWKLGEETIGYWHELETGFAGRKLLPS
jgi:hypothetical protein